jgi:hypothetical protein
LPTEATWLRLILEMAKELPLSPAITGAPTVLFVGAGASVPLGKYTSQDFPQAMLAHATLDPHAQHLLRILIGSTPTQVDVETLVSDLVLGDNHQELAKVYARVLSVGENRTFEDFCFVHAKLRDAVLSHVVEHYSDVDRDKAGYLYMWLFLWLKGYQEAWYPIPVFTTNYDWAFERMAEWWRKAQLVDGFRNTPAGLAWNPDVFHRLKGSHQKFQIVLFKLHGSTSWLTLPAGTILKVSHAEKILAA